MINTSQVLIFDLLILGCILIIGSLSARAIIGKTDGLTLLSLGFGLGVGVSTFFIFLVSWIGIRINIPTIIGLFIIICTFLSIAVRYKTRRSSITSQVKIDQSKKEFWGNVIIWFIIFLLVLVAIILSIGLSYYTWNDIDHFALKGYGIALEGTILAGKYWGTNGLSYPLNIHLIIAVFRIVDGDVLPGSKLVFPLFLLSLLIGCYRFLIFRGVKTWIASIGMLVLASTPIMFQHATTGYANIPFTFYLTLGLLWCIDGVDKEQNREKIMGGVLLGCAIWTRPEGVVIITAALLGLWVSISAIGKKKVILLPILMPVFIITLIWIAFSKLYPTSCCEVNQFITYSTRGILAGSLHLEAFSTIFRFIGGQIVRYRDWGFLPILIGLALALFLRWKIIKSKLSIATLFFASITMGIVFIYLHYIAAFSPEGSDYLYKWLSDEFNRLVMPVVVCLTLLALLGFSSTESAYVEDS